LHPGLSRLRGRTTVANTRLHALRRRTVSRLNMLHISLCTSAPSEPSRRGVAPGDGRFSRRPLLGADGFVFNANRRGLETGSNGQEEHAGLALLDGVMDQLHQRGTTAVQLALRSTPGTARSAGRHRATKRIIWLSGPANRECSQTRECPRAGPVCQAPTEEETAHRNRAP
jgi:hypothetical protein